MTTKCDCTVQCGDDPDIAKGKAEPCKQCKDWDSRPRTENISALLRVHAAMLESNPYCYFELARTRTTEWMAFICDKPAGGTTGTPEFGAGRKIIAKGQGATADEACASALAMLSAAA